MSKVKLAYLFHLVAQLGFLDYHKPEEVVNDFSLARGTEPAREIRTP